MSNGGEFRTALFGGFNKEDVRGYLQELERNTEVEKSEYQRDIVGLKSKLQKAQEENERLEEEIQKYKAGMEESSSDSSSRYTEEGANAEELETQKKENEELRQRIAQLEAENLELTENQKNTEAAVAAQEPEGINEEEYLEQLEQQKNENEKLRQEIDGLKSENLMFAEKKKDMERELEELKAASQDIEKNSSLQAEIQQMKEKKEKYENDFKVITQVLEDARISARHIQDEAQKKAEEILVQARKESREIIEGRKTQIDKELEDKGIRLMAAKYKIEAYRKEVNLTQQKLYNLYSDMGKLIEGMPQRLEQLWEDNAEYTIIDKEGEPENKEADRTEN